MKNSPIIIQNIKRDKFISELHRLDVRHTYKCTKWGSEYWSINGINYRLSDHRKPEYNVTSYIFGKNDFDNYDSLLNKVIEDYNEDNKIKHLTFEQKEILFRGEYLKINDPDTFDKYIAVHPDFFDIQSTTKTGDNSPVF